MSPLWQLISAGPRHTDIIARSSVGAQRRAKHIMAASDTRICGNRSIILLLAALLQLGQAMFWGAAPPPPPPPERFDYYWEQAALLSVAFLVPLIMFLRIILAPVPSPARNYTLKYD